MLQKFLNKKDSQAGLPIAAEFGKNGHFLPIFFPLPIFAEISDFRN